MSAITVSANDLANSALQGEITNIGTQITNATTAGNYPLVGLLTQLETAMQVQLVCALLGQGAISAATILAGDAATYTAPTQFTKGPIGN